MAQFLKNSILVKLRRPESGFQMTQLRKTPDLSQTPPTEILLADDSIPENLELSQTPPAGILSANDSIPKNLDLSQTPQA